LIAAGAGYLDFTAITLGTLILASLFFCLSAVARSRRNEIAAIHNSQRSLDQLLQLAKEASASYTLLHEERAQLTTDEQAAIAENADRNQELTRQLHRLYARIESARRTAVEAVEEELRSLQVEKDGVVAQKLRPFQQPWVLSRLPSFLLADARLSRITSHDVRSLTAVNVRTAADIAGFTLIKGGESALLITGSGDSVKVPGIGPRKAETLCRWRQECEEEARVSCPVHLPQDVETHIERTFKPRFEAITMRKEMINQEAEQKRRDARRELASERTSQADLHQEALVTFRAKRKELDRQITDIRATVAEVPQLHQSRNLLMMRARQVSYPRYLRFIYLR
jgi:hypothetical protein